MAAITLDDGSRKYYYAHSQAEARELLDKARLAKRVGRLRAVKSQTVGEFVSFICPAAPRYNPELILGTSECRPASN